jgi:hypothetical protein
MHAVTGEGGGECGGGGVSVGACYCCVVVVTDTTFVSRPDLTIVFDAMHAVTGVEGGGVLEGGGVVCRCLLLLCCVGSVGLLHSYVTSNWKPS